MKEIQEQRMRRYFIDACKTLIRGEGVHSVSARTVAEEAGYSYATLYNYFKDMKDLIAICVDEFIEETVQFVKDRKIKAKGEEAVFKKSKAIAMYFLQYPGIFQAVFTENLRELRTPTSFKEKLDNMFSAILDNHFTEINEEYSSNTDRKELLKLSIYSMLLLFLNRRCPTEYKEFVEYFDTTINYVIKKA